MPCSATEAGVASSACLSTIANRLPVSGLRSSRPCEAGRPALAGGEPPPPSSSSPLGKCTLRIVARGSASAPWRFAARTFCLGSTGASLISVRPGRTLRVWRDTLAMPSMGFPSVTTRRRSESPVSSRRDSTVGRRLSAASRTQSLGSPPAPRRSESSLRATRRTWREGTSATCSRVESALPQALSSRRGNPARPPRWVRVLESTSRARSMGRDPIPPSRLARPLRASLRVWRHGYSEMSRKAAIWLPERSA
mmetsp:Transcript_14014/g.44593  ORF Transcript_14014/g.44593 Transcript_14014/m.44593 type:complete len:252 (-) Transcript_14014:600-1355(-)